MIDFKKNDNAYGYREIFTPGKETAYTGLSLLNISNHEKYLGQSNNNELAIVILSGKCHVTVDDMTFSDLGTRRDVFSGRATTIYVPVNSCYTVSEAQNGKLEIAILVVPAEEKKSPFVITPDEVSVNQRGDMIWQREVHNIMTDNVEGKVHRIIVGETFSHPGHWSSYPPHKHDTQNLPVETKMDEIYLFKVNPGEGFGIQILYSEDWEVREALIVKDGDAVTIPGGYHPVAAAPGHQVYYLWVMAGEYGRKLHPKDDPKFKWLFNAAKM
ncbi:5-deoxy-glucuronate isomerase [Klebsiella aerogenes]|uniref:5-deoxy-glucuronate isomerase n=1 Tax=Klebsiella aerogenes TaxID=548 RepID=UPI00063C545A|nr:5-deoxy-glucuronate isomerase [Klebsiella aerogenes]ELI7202347.1 5-deoxy-glucuronate isomerase [Klebsiella aerogenes]KLF02078.1 myo-inositol catabolism protein LolB [Klebsiella aerogenes]